MINRRFLYFLLVPIIVMAFVTSSCDSGGATFHFCPVCGSTVFWDIAAAPDIIGIAVGNLTDPTFPPPKISGFESYGHPWAMKAADLPILRLKLAE